MPHHPTLAEVLVKFVNTDGAALVLAVDPANGRVDVHSGDLGVIDAAAREAVLVGVAHAVALERARNA
ncbi:hypothetical protein [Agromyces kandeliae]|uniref:Uncharacterized protein n=1 Tax=Agromyces kandeliae TaxID=2666141 RepID=A0A6L5QZR0_9MICO|nr:hypothetical protein [Agromyces kandeliae]MRX42337.1 hypothetical protein [Agromyces kandeliae]